MPQKNCSAAYARGEMRGSGIRFFPPGTFYQEVFTKPPCVCVCVCGAGVCVCATVQSSKSTLILLFAGFEFWTQILKCCVCTKLFYIISTFKPSVIVFNLIRSNSDCLSNLKIAKYSSQNRAIKKIILIFWNWFLLWSLYDVVSEESSLSEDARDSSRERSAYARGRSLPLELLDQLPRLPPLLPEDHQGGHT